MKGFCAKGAYMAFWVDFHRSSKVLFSMIAFADLHLTYLRNNLHKKNSFPSGIFRSESCEGGFPCDANLYTYIHTYILYLTWKYA